jgi:hypothetical protein
MLKYRSRKKGAGKFSLIDGMILSSARSVGQRLLTLDEDFRNSDEAIVIE